MKTNKDIEIIQKNELIILKEIKRICEANNITYYLSSGTLLGAIRHNGFIPWDDDIDIEMPLTDYKKFLKVCKNQLGDTFFLQNFDTDYNYHHAFIKVRMNNTTFMPVHHRKHHIHHGFWVDIFPIVSIPNNSLLFRMKKVLIMTSNYIQAGDFILANYDEFLGKLGKTRLNMVLVFNKLPVKLRILIHKAMLAIVFSKPQKEKKIGFVHSAYELLSKDYYTNLDEHVFEGEYFPIPKEFDEYLSFGYGDYLKLPPESERLGHGSMIVDENKDYTYYLQ